MKYLIAITALLVSTSAMAESFFTLPEGMLPKIIGCVIGLQLICAGLGEGLTKIAVHTETKYDNMAAAMFSKASWYLGALIGKMGWGMPKEVIKKEVAKGMVEKNL